MIVHVCVYVYVCVCVACRNVRIASAGLGGLRGREFLKKSTRYQIYRGK